MQNVPPPPKPIATKAPETSSKGGFSLEEAQKRLKKVEPKQNQISLQDLKEKEEQQKKQLEVISNRVRGADLEEWYDQLKDFTYPSLLCDISQDEAKAMMKYFESKDKVWNDTLEGLTSNLQKVMDNFPDGSFIKLSSRSPKDASVVAAKTVQIFKDIMSKNPKPSDNDKLIAINRAHILALNFKNAKEVVEMMLASERIYDDLSLALSFPERWNQHFIVRKFIPIPIEYEFRGFIVDNKFKAMCQYYHYLHFPEMTNKKEEIEKLVKIFFNEIRDKVPLDPKTYVIDFAVDMPSKKVYLIEINPFGDYEGMGTSTCMFNLKNDHELFFGNSNWEFRVETAPITNMYDILFDKWATLFREIESQK